VFVSADEEVGSPTAHPPMERLVPRGATALVLEPPLEDGSLKVRRKGVGMYRLEVEGAEAHAGLDPERGASAVAEVARRVLEVLSWADPARGITVNIGRIEGGIATNVVAGRAAAGIDMRFDELPAGEEIHRRLLELRPQDLRTRIAVTGGIIFPPLVPDAATERLAAIAQRVGRELGLELGLGKSGGGSDGCHLASRGVQVLDGLGVEGGGAHSPGEHVLIERLPVRAALLASLVLALDGEA
ncbi:MAG: M20/M25/M40 family metallo-hydrolase, partial [Planctomycetes bacterium]|nr:M20/M25/M40 family metallo-hydrolase [Planctomycetota bacterium]